MPELTKELLNALLKRFEMEPGAPSAFRSSAFAMAVDMCERYGECLETIMALNKLEDAVRFVAAAAKRKGE
jgi:hypothetical protein